MGCEHQLDGHGRSDDREPGEAWFTSPWWLFECATKRICRYLNSGWSRCPRRWQAKPRLVAASASETSKAAVSFYGYAIESETASVESPTRPAARCPHHECPLDTSPTWDGDAARERLKKWADGDWDKYALGFAYGQGQGGVESAYRCRTTTSRTATSSRSGAASSGGHAIMARRPRYPIGRRPAQESRPPRRVTTTSSSAWPPGKPRGRHPRR